MNEREVLFQGHEGHPVLNCADLDKWISYKGYILGLYYYVSISLMPRSVTLFDMNDHDLFLQGHIVFVMTFTVNMITLEQIWIERQYS